MNWGADLWDQYDVIDKHTQSGFDLVERYIKFVKERTEIEQNYSKQLRNLTKKYTKRGCKDEQDCNPQRRGFRANPDFTKDFKHRLAKRKRYSNYASFQDILKELNDYAGQREMIAENMVENICNNLSRNLLDLKQERKVFLTDVKKAQQTLESSFKHLETTKKRFAKEWVEVEKANQHVEKFENDTNATKIDVEKAKQTALGRIRTAEECRNDYAAELQKYNKEQNSFYYVEIPLIYNKLQDLDERRIRQLAEGYCQFSDIEKKVHPIISKCLEGISAAGTKVDEKQDSLLFIEQHKSGFERPADLEFEDYSHGIKPANSETTLNPPKLRPKLWPFKKLKQPAAEPDFSHLPPEQRKKKLQKKIEHINKELQKEQDQSDALEKMKGVYEQNPQMGDPSSLEPQITETSQKISQLRGELGKYEMWLSEAGGGDEYSIPTNNNIQHSTATTETSQNIYSEFDEFEDVESATGQCTALYTFEGNSEGTISIKEGELLTVMEEDKGDGWMRVLKTTGEEGYIPSSYVQLTS